MKELPMLFSTPMVKAILNGTKTQTRRIIKPQPVLFDIKVPVPLTDFVNNLESISKSGRNQLHSSGPGKGYVFPKCPYGNPGDKIWLRETWAPRFGDMSRIYYKADDNLGSMMNVDRWRPSIHMPKKAARIWLEVVSVRVERLQSITEADAMAEGVERWVEERMASKPIHYKVYCDLDNPEDPALYSSAAYDSFQSLWYYINGKESWDQNPWVWVVEFKRVQP